MTTVFKALSDDTRRQILKLLANGDMTAKEISENFTSVLQTTLGAFLDFFDTNKSTGKEGNDNETIQKPEYDILDYIHHRDGSVF